MAAMTGEQVAQVLYTAGFRGQNLINMVAIGKRESGYNPAAHRTSNPNGAAAGTGDFGLFQINYVNYPYLQRKLGLSSINQLLDPVTNAKAAFLLFQQGGLAPWGAGTGGWQSGGNPLYGTDTKAAKAAVDSASAKGMLGKDYQAPQSAPTGRASDNPATAGGPMELPPDAKLYNNGYGVFAVFEVNGVQISYGVKWWDGSVKFDPNKVTRVTLAQWKGMNVVEGGDAEELRDIKVTWGSYGKFWNSILDSVIGKNNPARNDPSVMRVIAQFAARPDMSPQELNNLLQATDWYQQHTAAELEWNSLSDAERVKRTEEVATQMVDTWFQFTGQRISSNDPRIMNHLEKLASGAIGFGSWTETVVKPAALKIDQSPWKRQLDDETKAQGQKGVDIENTAQRVKDLARRWGVLWSDRTAQEMADKIVMNKMSEADVINALKEQAAVLFPWKDPNIETSVAASPWVETMKRVMEVEADHMDPKVQQAMSAQMGIWDFEKSLKKSSGWLNTRNAREELVATAAEVGRRMGYE